MANDFTELQAWKLCRAFRKRIEEKVQDFPPEEKYRLVDQLIRSSRSVTANISEGHGRYHYQENIQACRMARGSLTETKDHLIVALDNSFISKEDYLSLIQDQERCLQVLNGYINFLRKAKQSGVQEPQTEYESDEFTKYNSSN